MGDLIAELRQLAEWPDDYGPASINDIAERAAGALEAAREESDRWQSRYRAAIDQARGIVPEAGQGVQSC